MTVTPNNIPAWYRQVRNMISIQQSEIICLTGDTMGYPVYPGENLTDYLRRMALAPHRKAVSAASPNLSTEDANRAVAERQLFAEVSPAAGLILDQANMQVMSNFAQIGGSLMAASPLVEAFQALDKYFTEGPGSTPTPPLVAVVHDADLIFDSEGPMVEPERTLLSYLRRWAAKPLVTPEGHPHRVFLIANSGVRPALLQGRIAPVNIQLPTEEERQNFIDIVLSRNSEDGRPIELRDGLSPQELARITGALNLLQIEDCCYQAEADGGALTREVVQRRKDELVRQAYGGVIQIEYPTCGFDSIIGYEPLKSYFTGYVQPKLKSGDSRCPKGCVLSGPPGTGKSQLAKALAAALQLPLVVVQGDKLKNKYVGESNKNMAKLCEGIAALSPAIVLLDEVDKLMPASDDSSGVSQELLGQLQTFMSDIERGREFFVATTNYPSRIPRALLRPGRFEQVLPMLPQHLDGLRDIAIAEIAKRIGVGLELSTSQLKKIGDKATDYTGADIEKLLIEGDRNATENSRAIVTEEDLDQALSWVVATAKQTQEMTDEAIEYCSNRRYVPDSMKSLAGQSSDSTTVRRRVRNME